MTFRDGVPSISPVGVAFIALGLAVLSSLCLFFASLRYESIPQGLPVCLMVGPSLIIYCISAYVRSMQAYRVLNFLLSSIPVNSLAVLMRSSGRSGSDSAVVLELADGILLYHLLAHGVALLAILVLDVCGRRNAA